MLTIIAKWTLLEGKREQALAALNILAARVQVEEPFVLMYTIHTPDLKEVSLPTPSANEVDFFSVFVDEASFQKHLNGPVFKNWLKEYIDLFLTSNGNLFVVSEFLMRQAGFVRQQMITTQH